MPRKSEKEMKCTPVRVRTPVEVVGQAHAEHERDDDADVAHHHRVGRAIAQHAEVQLHPHHEHEEDQADLAQELQVAQRGVPGKGSRCIAATAGP